LSKYCKILTIIKRNGANFVVFGDNASIHTKNFTAKLLREDNTSQFYNDVYTPVLNPIERFFLILKQSTASYVFNHYLIQELKDLIS
jgi:transposase